MNCVQDFANSELFWKVGVAGFMLLLGAAGIQDARQGEVSNFFWVCSTVWFLLFGLLAPPEWFPGEPIVFWILQQLWFSRLYGRADCHGFSCCGFWFWALGYGLAVCLFHMLLALLLLAVVQLIKGNVDKRGNLRTPVPFIPYILLGFCGIIVWIWK